MEELMNKELHFLYVLAFAGTIILCVSMYTKYIETIERNKVISEAVKFALDKGIDPLAVTCAYESSDNPSTLCIMYVNKTQVSGESLIQLHKK